MVASTGYLAISFIAKKCYMHEADASYCLASVGATRFTSMARVVLVSIV